MATDQPTQQPERGAVETEASKPDCRRCGNVLITTASLCEFCENELEGERILSQPERGAVSLSTVSETLAFFASVIKSGESWTEACYAAYEGAQNALAAAESQRVRVERWVQQVRAIYPYLSDPLAQPSAAPSEEASDAP